MCKMDWMLENSYDVHHRAYMTCEKKIVIKFNQLDHIILLCLNGQIMKLVCVQVLGPLRLRYHEGLLNGDALG
jgi:hypothetical protein